jgi:hypothetical protein
MLTRIYKTDDYLLMARKIYDGFDINQSCTVTGEVADGEKIYEKGRLVVDELRRIDRVDNCVVRDGKWSRRNIKIPDSIGGYEVQKAFRFVRREDGSWVIWRVQ